MRAYECVDLDIVNVDTDENKEIFMKKPGQKHKQTHRHRLSTTR